MFHLEGMEACAHICTYTQVCFQWFSEEVKIEYLLKMFSS